MLFFSCAYTVHLGVSHSVAKCEQKLKILIHFKKQVALLLLTFHLYTIQLKPRYAKRVLMADAKSK